MAQVSDTFRLHNQIRRSLLEQPRENQISVARWLKLLNEQSQPAMDLLTELDSGKIEFEEAMERLNKH